MKRIRRIVSMLSVVVLIFVLGVFSVSAANIEIMPMSDYTLINTSICYKSGTSSVTYGCRLQGNSTRVGKISYTCQLQIKDGAWTDVKGEKFSNTDTGYIYEVDTVSGTKGEMYRCEMTVTIYNTSGAVLERFINYSAGISL